MKFISTRGGIEPLTFIDAVLTGYANDGFLFPDLEKIFFIKKPTTH